MGCKNKKPCLWGNIFRMYLQLFLEIINCIIIYLILFNTFIARKNYNLNYEKIKMKVGIDIYINL